MTERRAIVLVCDSLGVGELPDAQLGESSDAEELRARFLSFVTIGEEAPMARALVHEHLM